VQLATERCASRALGTRCAQYSSGSSPHAHRPLGIGCLGAEDATAGLGSFVARLMVLSRAKGVQANGYADCHLAGFVVSTHS